MFIVYGKEDCTFCVQSVELLKSKGEVFIYKKLDVDYTREDLFHIMGKLGATPRTMPQIVSENGLQLEYVGGFRELQKFLNKAVDNT